MSNMLNLLSNKTSIQNGSFVCSYIIFNTETECYGSDPGLNKNSAEVDILPAFREITTACNVGQAKKRGMVCA